MEKIVVIIIIFILILTFLNINNTENFDIVNTEPPFPIDIVYTWAGENNLIENQRLSYNNELQYSIRSIMKFAPWVNKIYILMNPPKKKPSWFNNSYGDKVIIYDHNDTFDEENLPCTNSNSIETTLINIPNLSEHFIYFNDDVFLGNYVDYTDFFSEDGEKMIVNSKLIKKCRDMNLEDSEKIINFEIPEECGISDHIPFAFKKSIINEFQEKYPEYIKFVRSIKNRKYFGSDVCKKNNLRNACQQQHGPISKYAYDNNKAISKNIKAIDKIYIEFNSDPYLKKLSYIKYFKPKFFCINDTKIANMQHKQIFYSKIKIFFDDYYFEKPYFEI